MARLKIDRLTADERLQHREDAKNFPGCANPELAAEYAEAIKAGAKFPPVKIVHDKGAKTYWLYDGFHTVAATEKAGKPQVEADIVEGTFEDALRLSWLSNTTHGTRRKWGDLKNVLTSYYSSGNKKNTAAREVAKATGISEAWIKRVRAELEEGGYFRANSENTPGEASGTDTTGGEGGGGATTKPEAEKRGRGRPPGPGKRKKAGKGKPQDNGHDGEPADSGQPVKDQEGNTVPDDIRHIFKTLKPVLESLMDKFNECRDALRSVEKDTAWIAHAKAKEAAEAWLSAVASGLPHAVCPACKGAKCERCRKVGYLPEAHYLDLTRELEITSTE
jgi:hypothetical protein